MIRESSSSVFTQKVIQVIQYVPRGRVVSYGQVAVYIGAPRAARQVGWVLKNLDNSVSIPWWRVVNNKGRISIKGNLYNDKVMQKKLLKQEGIAITDEYILDIEKYRYIADNKMLIKWQLPKDYIEKVMEKYSM